tara:strand:+ start:4394 stop:4837 length:444 start_codon:yes stop_codon:yes gene_type:complete
MIKKNKNNLIETYELREKGFHPLLIRDNWQVAKLNYLEDQNIRNIKKLDIHFNTDEVFVLLKGKAVIIAAVFENGIPVFEMELMEQNLIYNIPKNRWHNIAMEEGSEVLLVEKSNTHLSDFDHFNLDSKHITILRDKVEELLKNKTN